jgi:hypothetical protein
MARTTADAVKELLAHNYDSDAEPSLAPHVETAAAMVARVVTCATARAYTHTAAELELIERWLAAWFYTRVDPTYKSRSTLGASGAFNSDPSDYRAQAESLDGSGCLKAILAGSRASLVWLGRYPRDQTPYEDRR